MTMPMGMMDPMQEGLPDMEYAMQDVVASAGQPMGQPSPPKPAQAENLLPPDEDEGDPELLRKSALGALYGSDFPLIDPDGDEPSRQQWAHWGKSIWDRHRGAVLRRLWLVARNRKMYDGDQWITSKGMGPWKEPPKPRDAARRVENMIKPALDQRTEIISEQRPGFRTKPTNQDPDKLKRAEAQQMFLEYQYDQQRMDMINAEAAHCAGTDGVSFLHTFWNPDKGPWYESGDGSNAPLGDMDTEVLRIEQVRVSANATATRRPHYVVIRKTIPTAEAVAMFGEEVAGERESGESSATSWLNDTTAREDNLIDQDTVDQFYVYCDRSEYLPNGLTLMVVGNRAVFLGDLICGTIPVARVSDGSTDPSYFCAARMEDWLDSQMTINATISKWQESIRKNSDGRLMARPGSIVNETLVGGTLSVVEVKGVGALADAVTALPSFSVGADAKEMYQLAVTNFENKSGWNDTSRGSISSNTSGRAVLAIREQLERVFAPGVKAMCEANTEWGKICLHWARWGYDIPRMIAVTGESRSDLAREVTAEDFDGIADVSIDPETMMPLPRPLRLFLLDNLLEKGGMDMKEYRRRMPFAFVQNLETSDTRHFARAKRVADAIKNRQPAPEMRWQDDESIHQEVLDSEILLNDDLEPDIIAAANQRWMELAGQAAQKMAPPGAPQAPSGPPSAPGGGLPQGPPIDPAQAPLASQNSPVATAPAATLAAGSDPQIAQMLFERGAPQ